MRNRISPATTISLVALFFSLTGAGVAASRYLITSTSQIKPKVLQALHGSRGLTGAPGTAGTVAWDHEYTVYEGADIYADTTQADVTARCDPGDHALSGGFEAIQATVTTSAPMDSGARGAILNGGHYNSDIVGWRVSGTIPPGTSGAADLIAYAVCVKS